MSDRVVLAPEQTAVRTIEAVKEPGTWAGFRTEIRWSDGSGIVCTSHYFSPAEARHLRDLLCEWFGLPECKPTICICRFPVIHQTTGGKEWCSECGQEVV